MTSVNSSVLNLHAGGTSGIYGLELIEEEEEKGSATKINPKPLGSASNLNTLNLPSIGTNKRPSLFAGKL